MVGKYYLSYVEPEDHYQCLSQSQSSQGLFSALPPELILMIPECCPEDDRPRLLQRLIYLNRKFYVMFAPQLKSWMDKHYQNFEFRFDSSESLERLDLLLNRPYSRIYVQKVIIRTGSLLRPQLEYEKVSIALEAVEILEMVISEDRFRRALPLLPNLTTLVIDQPEDVQNIKNSQLRDYKGHCHRLIDNIASFMQDLSLTRVNVLGVDGSSNAPGAIPIVARNGTQFVTAVRESQLTEFVLSTLINKHSGTVPATFMRIDTNTQSSCVRRKLHGSWTQRDAIAAHTTFATP
jgi:hypothetical protein